MTIELSPEQERAIHEAIEDGLIRSVDDFITIAITTLLHSKGHSESSPQAAIPGMEESAEEYHPGLGAPATRKSLHEGRLPPSAIGAGNFFAGRSITDLAESQKVKPIRDASMLAGGIPDDVDLDEFLGDIYASRK